MSTPRFDPAHRVARDLHIQLWRRKKELWPDRPQVVMDILPLDLDLVATRLLGLYIERAPEIPGDVDGCPIAGLWYPKKHFGHGAGRPTCWTRNSRRAAMLMGTPGAVAVRFMVTSRTRKKTWSGGGLRT